LKLAKNKIKDIKGKLSVRSSSLISVDLSENDIFVTKGVELQAIVDEFGCLAKIKSINISGNPVLKQFPQLWVAI